MISLLQSKHVLVTGATGSGKTWLCRGLARLRPNGIVVDTVGAFGFGTALDWSTIGALGRGGWFRVDVHQVSNGRGLLRAVLALVYRAARAGALPRPYTVVLEEADRYGRAGWNLPEIQRLVDCGRNFDLSVVVNLHRLAAAPEEYFHAAGVVLYGYTPPNAWRDNERLKKILGPGVLSIYRANVRNFLFLAVDSACNLAIVGVDRDQRSLFVRRVAGLKESEG